MEKPFFEFKQFKVYQDKSGMKVGTDGVLLGAVSDFGNSEKILDIGSGTGLLSLMAAQKSNAQIIAVEIDQEAFLQSSKNFEISPWKNRLQALNISFQDFWPLCKTKFNYIICNPPYFINSLKSEQISRTLARHNDSLPFEQLFLGTKNILSENGKLSIIIPYKILYEIIETAGKKNLYPQKIYYIKPDTNKEINRCIILFSNNINEIEKNTIVIENGRRHEYTEQYKNITKEFYLNM